MKRLVVLGVVAMVTCVATPSWAAEVCTYNVRYTLGAFCPVRSGASLCLKETAAIGPCDGTLRCFAGPGFFCQAELVPVRGPAPVCPHGSVIPRGLICYKPITPGPAPTDTPPPPETETPTFTPTATAIPTGTASATVTETVAGATETAIATETATAVATETETVVPTGTATEPATPTETLAPTGTPTGTAAAVIGGALREVPWWRKPVRVP